MLYVFHIHSLSKHPPPHTTQTHIDTHVHTQACVCKCPLHGLDLQSSGKYHQLPRALLYRILSDSIHEFHPKWKVAYLYAKAGKPLLYFSSVKNLAIENVLLALPYLVLSTVLVWHWHPFNRQSGAPERRTLSMVTQAVTGRAGRQPVAKPLWASGRL